MRKQLTGEPVAGELHTGFGGRGRRQPFPTPIQQSDRVRSRWSPDSQSAMHFVRGSSLALDRMKETFTAPQFTTFCSPQSIARNIGSVSHGEEAPLEQSIIEVERTGSSVRWHQGGSALTFSLEALAAVEVKSVEHGGKRFVALVLTFNSGEEALRYRMITSHASEANLLRRFAERIGHLLSLPVTLEGVAS